MNRRDLLKSVPLGALGLAVPLKPDAMVGENVPWIFKLADGFDPHLTELDRDGVLKAWHNAWGGEDKAPQMLILTGLDLIQPMPGKYGYHRRVGNVEENVTFQTLEEMNDYINTIVSPTRS